MRFGLVLREEYNLTVRYGLVSWDKHSPMVRFGLVLRDEHTMEIFGLVLRQEHSLAVRFVLPEGGTHDGEIWSCSGGGTQADRFGLVLRDEQK